MSIIIFPIERVIEINYIILSSEPGMKGTIDVKKLDSALGRISNHILYNGLDDVFEIAADYAASISIAHALPDANKRTALMVALEYLSLNDFEISNEKEGLANAMVDLVLEEINISDFADILYSLYIDQNNN